MSLLRCLRYSRSIWVEKTLGMPGHWRWVIRSRFGRVLLHSKGTWGTRHEAVGAVRWLEEQIDNVVIEDE